MHLDALRDDCLTKPHATEDLPFGPDVLTFKVAGKMFALTNLERIPASVSLKCDPERAVMLREQYDAIGTAPHMNKRHWIQVALRGDVPADVIRELVDHSSALVVGGLPKRVRAMLDDGADGAN